MLFMKKITLKIADFYGLLRNGWYNLSSKTLKPEIGPFLLQIGGVLAALFVLLGIGGCSTIKYVPIETETKIEIRDSVVYVRDTVTVEIPKEVVKEIVPQDTISILKTSVAKSEARVERGQLYHNLEQRGTIKTRVDTFYVTQIEERIVYQDRPIEVVKEVKHIPTFFWWSLILNVIGVLLVAFKIYLKFKQ
jgi:hypothetical protein